MIRWFVQGKAQIDNIFLLVSLIATYQLYNSVSPTAGRLILPSVAWYVVSFTFPFTLWNRCFCLNYGSSLPGSSSPIHCVMRHRRVVSEQLDRRKDRVLFTASFFRIL